MEKNENTYVSSKLYKNYVIISGTVGIMAGWFLGISGKMSDKYVPEDVSHIMAEVSQTAIDREVGRVSYFRYELADAKRKIDSLQLELSSLNAEPIAPIRHVQRLKEQDLVVGREEYPVQYTQDILNDIKDVKVRDYISGHYKVALREQELFGIPASVTLAQALIESASGTSPLAENQKNHFGIKYWGKPYPERVTHVWDKLVDISKVVNIHDDDKDDMFLAFQGVWHCYRFHSYFLAGEGSKYLEYLPANPDYKDWCNALKKGGYATSPSYSRDLIKIIEKYKLHKIDKLA